MARSAQKLLRFESDQKHKIADTNKQHGKTDPKKITGD
jgi:hypothetical protein